jgi:hypothetical protein
MRSVFWIASLLAAPVAYGQLESDTLLVRASRSIRPSPDLVLFQLQLLSNLNTGFEDVVAAMPGLGITPANLIDLQSHAGESTASWIMYLFVPFDKLKVTAATLRRLQQTVSQNPNSMMLSFGVLGSQVSSESKLSQTCSISDLVSDARRQADQVAAAAGLMAGPILGMSDGNSGEPSPTAATIELFPLTDPLTGEVIYPTAPTILTRPVPDPFSCIAEIKFRLLRYQ